MNTDKHCRPVNLALQGGGAHGAYTWGVLDKLLEDGRIRLEGISGTSAGAMNGVVAVHGWMRDGADGARQALWDFWQAVSRAALTSPIQRSPWDVLTGNWSLDHSPSYLTFDILSRMVSPYELNPLNINPLRDLLVQQVDFELVRSCNQIKLFISATNVRTGRVKVFNRHELTAEMILASACLPFMFQAVEIDGEAYWDGGYIGNPVLFPFAYECLTRDVVIVQINPIERAEVPRTARDILNRVNEISFNAALMKELRAINFVSRLIDEGHLDTSRYKQMLIHRIDAEEELKPLGASSKMNAEWAFLKLLHDIGQRAAEEWLDQHHGALGQRSTVAVRELFE